MSHFLFVAGALRERTSEESAELQLGHSLWGLCTGLIRTNLQTYLDEQSRGLVYVLKVGLCAEFQILSPVLDFPALDAFISDELRTEARFGFVRIRRGAPVSLLVRCESGVVAQRVADCRSGRTDSTIGVGHASLDASGI